MATKLRTARVLQGTGKDLIQPVLDNQLKASSPLVLPAEVALLVEACFAFACYWQPAHSCPDAMLQRWLLLDALTEHNCAGVWLHILSVFRKLAACACLAASHSIICLASTNAAKAHSQHAGCRTG